MANIKKKPGEKNGEKTSEKTSVKSACASKPGSKNSRTTEFAQDQCKLTDYDIVSDVLGSHKNIIKLYGTALCEIDAEELRDLVSCKMNECAEDQLDVFLYMSERGMYKTEPAPLQKVKETRQRFSGCVKNLEK